MRRPAPASWRWVAGALLLLAHAACDGRSDDRGVPDGGGTSRDAGTSPPPIEVDASIDGGIDAGTSGPDGGPTVAPDEYDTSVGGAADGFACFDGEDNDRDGVFDCGDSSCQAGVPSCCVGHSSDACCPTRPATALPLASCDGDLGGCTALSDYVVFGAPRPYVSTRGTDAGPSFVPGGDANDSGVAFDQRLDPRAGPITLSATIATDATAPSAPQVDVLAFGLIGADDDLSGAGRLTPRVGFQVSRNRQEVSLLLAGERVASWSIATTDYVTYALHVEPDGRISFEIGGAEQLGTPLVATHSGELRAVAYGRTPNPTSTEMGQVRASALSVSTRACDMPAAIVRASAPVVPAPLADPTWADSVDRIEGPHVLRYVDSMGTTVTHMVLSVDGEIHLAQMASGGFELVNPVGTPDFVPTSDAWAAAGVSDPALRLEGGALQLIYTAHGEGTSSVALATWESVSARFEHAAVLLPGTATESFEQATPFDLAGAPHLAVRVRSGGSSRIDLYSLSGTAATFVSTVTSPHATELFAFDRDEVAHPAVIVLDSIPRLYYAGRRGTRWSIGVLVGHALGTVWVAPPSSSPLLAGDGQGFDALGVRDPAPFLHDPGTGPELRLYYTGTDGDRSRIGVAVGPAPAGVSTP